MGKVKLYFFLIVIFGEIFYIYGQKYLKEVTITEREKKLLDELRTRIVSNPNISENFQKQDIFLIKWLRHAFLNVDQAEKMILENAKWRKENRMETILDEDWSEFNRDFPYYMKGKDKEGLPLLYLYTGEWDTRKAVVSGRASKLIRYVDKCFEESARKVRELGDRYGNVTQAVIILDESGFNLIQHACLQCFAVMLRVITSYETHFPGYAEKLILINTPAAAEPMIRIAREALHPISNRALKVFGTNRKLWWKELMKDFTPDQLPERIGGTLKLEKDEQSNDNELDNFSNDDI